MSYKKLVIKSTPAIEIEEVIAYYAAINMTLATKLEKETRPLGYLPATIARNCIPCPQSK